MADPIKLKTTQVKKTRLELLEAQGYKCGICSLPCSEEQACLDHRHNANEDGEAGYVRGVLHRTCNAVEGKVVNAMRRYGITDPYAFMSGLVLYHQKHATNQTGLIHPAHFTAEEKIERRKIKAKKKRAAEKAAKLAGL